MLSPTDPTNTTGLNSTQYRAMPCLLPIHKLSTHTMQSGTNMALRTTQCRNGINPYLYYQLGNMIGGIDSLRNAVTRFQLVGWGSTIAEAEKMAKSKGY